MTSLTIQFSDSSKLQKVINFIKRLQLPFQIVESGTEEETLWEPHIHAIIQKRLIDKYVSTGEWAKMDDEERQDASLLERMLYDAEQPSEGHLPESETSQFLSDLKKGLYATHH
jgi:hypothetical protein